MTVLLDNTRPTRERGPGDTPRPGASPRAGAGGGAATAVETFGCRLNALESEAIRQHAEAAGLRDVVVVNTCAVTAEAVRQARQTIRRARRERPDRRIVVTGCAAQIDPAAFAEMEEVDLVVGNREKTERATWEALAGGAADEPVEVGDIMAVRAVAGHLVDGFATRTRAFVEVQNGCDHRCTFCVIPYGRGPSRSVPPERVVEQIRRLVDRGHREVVLTGVDLTSYGPDLDGAPRLGDLVRRILRAVPDLPRLRLSSIDSIEVDGPLMEAIATEARLMPHLHLSLQAGDDLTLKRMKRRHLTADAVAFCEAVRAARPEVVFGADLIAGFPTETEAMFENTLAHVAACGLDLLHVFPFSPRPGTPAARMPQVPKAVARERAGRLRALGERRLAARLAAEVGARRRVLVEEPGLGRTEGFLKAAVEDAPGRIVDVAVTGVADGLLTTQPIGSRNG